MMLTDCLLLQEQAMNMELECPYCPNKQKVRGKRGLINHLSVKHPEYSGTWKDIINKKSRQLAKEKVRSTISLNKGKGKGVGL